MRGLRGLPAIGFVTGAQRRAIERAVLCSKDPSLAECQPVERSSSGGLFGGIGDLFEDIGDALQEGLDSAGRVIQDNVVDPIAEGFTSAGEVVQDNIDDLRDTLHDIEKANRDAIQRLAPCAVGVGVTYFTGGATSAQATALCLPALIPGGQPEMVPMTDPRAQDYYAEHGGTFEPGDPTLWGIPGLPAPTKSNAVLYGAAAIGLLVLFTRR